MSRNNRSKKRNDSYRPNAWGALQNVLIAGLNKGQLLGMSMAVIAIILIIKIPSDDVLPFIKSTYVIFQVNSILGWVLFILSIFVTYGLTKWQRRIHTKEIQRISREKKYLQEKLSKGTLPTSNK